MLRGFRFAARRAAAAARPRRTRTATPLPAGFVNSQTAITDEALLEVATDRWHGDVRSATGSTRTRSRTS